MEIVSLELRLACAALERLDTAHLVGIQARDQTVVLVPGAHRNVAQHIHSRANDDIAHTIRNVFVSTADIGDYHTSLGNGRALAFLEVRVGVHRPRRLFVERRDHRIGSEMCDTADLGLGLAQQHRQYKSGAPADGLFDEDVDDFRLRVEGPAEALRDRIHRAMEAIDDGSEDVLGVGHRRGTPQADLVRLTGVCDLLAYLVELRVDVSELCRSLLLAFREGQRQRGGPQSGERRPDRAVKVGFTRLDDTANIRIECNIKKEQVPRLFVVDALELFHQALPCVGRRPELILQGVVGVPGIVVPVDLRASISVEVPTDAVVALVQIGPQMHGAQQSAVRLQLPDHGVLDVAIEPRLRMNRLLVRSHSLDSDPISIEMVAVHLDVPVGLPVRHQGIANDDIVRVRHVVKLLVPLFHHGPMAPAAVVAENDENVVTDLLTVARAATAADARHGEADLPLQGPELAILLGEVGHEGHLGMRQLPRLCVVASLPIQHAQL
mmetsp:Transcript_18426/g.48798  ORF Transcript_18426/g.48798 Transcript_18426/m.48798 type:complete len:495 (-) Transcript_18426:838-2322(-)